MPQFGLNIDASNPVALNRTVPAEHHTSFEFYIRRCHPIAGNEPEYSIHKRSEQAKACQCNQQPELAGFWRRVHDPDGQQQRQLSHDHDDEINPDDPTTEPVPGCRACSVHVASPGVCSVRRVSSSATRDAVALSSPPMSMAPYEEAVVTRRVDSPRSCSSGPWSASTVWIRDNGLARHCLTSQPQRA